MQFVELTEIIGEQEKNVGLMPKAFKTCKNKKITPFYS